MSHRLFVNDDRTVLVRFYDDGTVECALRDDTSGAWGPPLQLFEEGKPPPSLTPEERLAFDIGAAAVREQEANASFWFKR